MYVFGTKEKPSMRGVSKHDTGKNPGVRGGGKKSAGKSIKPIKKR